MCVETERQLEQEDPLSLPVLDKPPIGISKHLNKGLHVVTSNTFLIGTPSLCGAAFRKAEIKLMEGVVRLPSTP
jgi:hypothetical protein